MAKKKFNLDPSLPKTKKASDEKINEVINELEGKGKQKIKKQKLIQFNVKLPENIYNAMARKSASTGLSKKAILVQALIDKLGIE